MTHSAIGMQGSLISKRGTKPRDLPPPGLPLAPRRHSISVAGRVPGTRTLRNPHPPHEPSPRQIQVHQPTGHEKPLDILLKTSITYLVEPEESLEHQKRMLHHGPDPRLGTIPLPLHLRQRPVTVTLKSFALGAYRRRTSPCPAYAESPQTRVSPP